MTDNRCKLGGRGSIQIMVLHVLMVSANESSENDQHRRKMKWRGRRGAHWRRDAPIAKKKRVIGRKILI